MENLFSLRSIAVALAFSLLALSCDNDDDNGGTLPAGGYPVTFGAMVEGVVTKSTSSNTWDGGEEVAVSIGGTVKKYTAASDGKLTNTTSPFYWQHQTETKTVQAWYPYSAAAPTSWTVEANQSAAADYQASDFLYAPTTSIAFANRETEQLKFYHQTAKVVINIVNGEAATNASDITGVTIGGAANLALSGDYSPPTGAATTGTWSNLSGMGVVTPQAQTATDTYLKSYTALVIPQDMTGEKFIAITLSNGNTYYYTPTAAEADLKGGKQQTYNITVKKGYLEVDAQTGGEWTDDGNEPVVSYTKYTANLKPGDYYYSDGTTSDGGLRKLYTDGTSVGAGTVAPESGKTVRGIVFWVGDPTKGVHYNGTAFTDFGDPALKDEHSGCTHGLVVALEDAGAEMKWQTNYTAIGDAGTVYQTITTNTGAGERLNKLRGYNNTQVIRAYNTYVGISSRNSVLPVQAIDTWAASNSAPAGSSGWYFPSGKELTLLCGKDVNNILINNSGGTGMRDIVNASINKAGATAIAATHYWSSSEFARYTDYAFAVSFSNGDVDYGNKSNNTCRVRSVLAF